MKPNDAKEQREVSLTPPHKPITQKRTPVSEAVLKFGCLSIKNIKKQKVIIEINFFSMFMKFQCANRFDASKIKKGLIKSDGCRLKLPRTNHLEDPFTVIPVMLVRKIKKNNI